MKLKIRVAVVLFLTTLSLGAHAGGTIEKADMAGIYNYSVLSGSTGFAGPKAGFGGVTEPSAMASLKDQGYTTVINLRLANERGVDIEGSRAEARRVGLRYVHIPFDSGNPRSTAVDNFLAVLGNPANQPVYVHCGSATRAAALWMIGRVRRDGWTIDEAAKEAGQIAGRPDAAVGIATGYLTAKEN